MRPGCVALALLAATLLVQGAVPAPAVAQALEKRHGLSAFGDLKYPSNFNHFDYVNPQAPKGGRIRLAVTDISFDHFNPYILKGDPASGASLIFDSLMASSSDEPDAMYGLVAHSVSMPADRAYAIFHLRAEARFSDGSPVTAADVVWSFETLKSKGHPYFRAPLRGVEKATALDALTVRYDFAAGAIKRDLPGVVAGLPIFSKKDFTGRAFDQPSVTPPIGSGPYKLGGHQAPRWVEYHRRPDYWAKDLPLNRGRHNFDVIRYDYFRDRDVSLEAFKSGTYDFIEEFTSANWALKYNFQAVRKGWVIKQQLLDGRPSGTQGWWINTRREKFKDVRVRRAIDLAYDFEQANRQLFYGVYQRTDSFFENSVLQAEGAPGPGELALLTPLKDQLPPIRQAFVFGAPYAPPVNSGDGDARPNLLKARALLAEAGWTIQDKTLRNAKGEKLVIEFLQASSGFDKIVRPFIFNLQVLGIEARLRKVDLVAYQNRLKAFDFDMTVDRFVVGSTPGVELRSYLHSSTARQKGSRNLAGVSDPAIDALLADIQKAENRKDLIAASKALDRVFRAGNYWVSNWYKGTHAVAYWDRFGKPQDLGVNKPPYDRGVLDLWWFDAEKSAKLDAARGR